MFTAWMRCLRPGGWMLLEYTRQHRPDQVSELDPFGIEIHELVYMLTRLGGGEWSVRTILDRFPFPLPPYLKTASVVVVERAARPLIGVSEPDGQPVEAAGGP
jgi:hypothetical protein